MTQSSNKSDQGSGDAAASRSAPTPESTPLPPQFSSDAAPRAVSPPAQGVPGTGINQPASSIGSFKSRAGLNPARWWTGAVAGAVAYLALLLLSLVTALLLVLGLAGSESDSSMSVPSNPFVSDSDLPSPWSILFQFAAQLPALGLMGSLGGSFDADLGMFGQISATFSAFAMPLLITLAAFIALYTSGRIAERRLPSVTLLDRLMQSVVAGVVFSLILNLIATIAAIRFSAESDMDFSLNAVNAASVIVAFLVGAGTSFAGRTKATASIRSEPRQAFARSLLRDVCLTVATHSGLFLLICIPAAVIIVGVKAGWPATLSAPLWAPTAGLFLLGLGHFAALGTVMGLGDGGGLGKRNFGYGVGGDFAEFGIPAWAGWLLVLLALISIAAAATYWYLRRGPKDPKSILGWTALPLGFLAAGALLLWASGVHASFGMSLGSGGASVGLAWWTPFLMMLWGVGVEAASRYLAPVVAPILPAALVSRIQRNPSVLAYAPVGASATAAPGVRGEGVVPPPGYLAEGVSPTANAPVTVAHTPLSKKAKRNLALVGGAAGLVVVLIGGGAIAANVMRAGNGPEKVVEKFLAAMVDGNAEDAMAIADPSISNVERVLLTNEIYQKASARPDGFTVLKTTEAEDSASVLVELRQNGVKSETTYQLLKTNPTLLNNNWSLKGIGTGLVSVQLAPEQSTILVNGVEVDLAGINIEGGYSYQLPALPGSYALDLPQTSKYLSAEPATAVVSIQETGSGKSASLTPKPNAAFSAAVNEQVSTLLKACAAQKLLNPKDCPFSTYEYSDVRNISWEITKEPVVDVYAGSKDNQWTLSTEKSGEAIASYERNTSFGSKTSEWKNDTAKTQVYPRGEVIVDKDQLTVKFTD